MNTEQTTFFTCQIRHVWSVVCQTDILQKPFNEKKINSNKHFQIHWMVHSNRNTRHTIPHFYSTSILYTIK